MHVAAAQAPASFGLDFRAIKCSGRDMPVAGNSAGADGSSLLQALKGESQIPWHGLGCRTEQELSRQACMCHGVTNGMSSSSAESQRR